jgi:acetoin utilization deacetylase AcuC-like enzyme
MSTGLIYHDRFLDHDTGPGHPERPARLQAVSARLAADGLWPRLEPIPFAPARRDVLERLHAASYVDRCFVACASGQRYLDSLDVGISRDSAAIAQLAAGGALAAVDAVVQEVVSNAVCLMRPPGHHAEADRAMGFCLFGNVALAADHLIRTSAVDRVAIVDWDVHHGNGTQHLLETRDDILYISLHEDPRFLYPGTGYAHETGRGRGAGFTLNFPLPPGSDDDTYRAVMQSQVTPKLEAFEPQFILISAGYDAAAADPLAHMELTGQGFAWMTQHVRSLADKLCGGRLVSMLEGGYDLEALAEGVSLHVASLV